MSSYTFFWLLMMYLYRNHNPTLIYNMLSVTYTNVTYLYMLVGIYYIILFIIHTC